MWMCGLNWDWLCIRGTSVDVWGLSPHSETPAGRLYIWGGTVVAVIGRWRESGAGRGDRSLLGVPNVETPCGRLGIGGDVTISNILGPAGQ
jgi:hypothetical protein